VLPPPTLVGFYSKIHHAALDGKGGTVLANAVLDLSATPREVAPADPAHKGRKAGDLKIGEAAPSRRRRDSSRRPDLGRRL
jgi:hypothetical protein